MFDPTINWFTNDDLMPHGMCFLWDPWLVWLHAVSDGLITAAYYGIPMVIVYFVLKRRDIVYRHVFLLSGLFVLACGTTHAMGIWVLWNPHYAIEGTIKAATAVVSLASLAAMWRVVPEAIALPSPSQFQAANEALEREVADRRRAEHEVTVLNHDLEARVAERTAELEAANAVLRQKVEGELLLVREIHHRVKNNLQTMSSMLRLQAEEAGPGLAPEFVTAQRRIGVMAQIHEELYRASGADTVDFGRYLEQLCADLDAFYGLNERVSMNVRVERLDLDLDQATALALVANEAIANACAHAFPDGRAGSIDVSLRRLGQAAELFVSDDGVGLSDAGDMPPEGDGSMGSLIMRALTEQIGGQLEITSNGGTRATIRFTVAETRTT